MPPLAIRIDGFSTKEDRAGHDDDQGDILVTRTFQLPYHSPPQIIMGLDLIDVCVGTSAQDTGPINRDTIGIKSTAEEIDEDTFQARIGIWGDGGMSTVACKWIEAAHKNLNNIQSGTIRTTLHNLGTPFQINFNSEFNEKVPKVLVWLQGFQLGSKESWEFGGKVVNGSESKTGFKLEVWKGEKTILYQSMFSWIAFEELDDQICGGVCELNPPKAAGRYSERHNKEIVEFETAFTNTPRVVQCISGMKVDGIEDGLRIDITGATATKDNITCPVMTWARTSVEVHASWIAVA